MLKDKILNKTARIAVVGIGYVGLPLAVEKGKVGYKVIGIDCNPERVRKINHGQNYISDVKDEELKALVESGKLEATGDFQVIKEVDVIIICVPTPLTKTKDPDISYIVYVAEKIAEHLKSEKLLVLESTTYPGTTEEVILPILEKSGLKVGKDFYLAFSPERVDPGNKRYTTKNTFKLVGGVTEKCLDIARAFYDQTIINVIPCSSPKVAEMTKVFENTFRSVNISLVNELMMLCDRMGINVWEVIDTASTKNFGFMPFYPGPGVGGHCIPIDPYYLTWKAKEYDLRTRFIELAGEINDIMPYYTVEKVQKTLNKAKKSLNGAKILILGVAYKKDIDDARESPALKIIRILKQEGAEIVYNDPFIPEISIDGNKTKSVDLTDELLSNMDCILIVTDHSSYDYERIVRHARVIVDARNGTKNVKENKDKIVRL